MVIMLFLLAHFLFVLCAPLNIYPANALIMNTPSSP